MNVLIADDEKIVLEGLKYIIDWNRLGFTICQTACDGQDAFEKIKSLNPDLVLLDIRMPKMTGIEVVQAAVESGYTGKFIILSGVTDFKLAQTAMRYGVDFYLTKPIDEDELEQAVSAVHELILKEAQSQTSYEQYRNKAKTQYFKKRFCWILVIIINWIRMTCISMRTFIRSSLTRTIIRNIFIRPGILPT